MDLQRNPPSSSATRFPLLQRLLRNCNLPGANRNVPGLGSAEDGGNPDTIPAHSPIRGKGNGVRRKSMPTAPAGSMSLSENLEQIFLALRRACEEVYGERLVAVAAFGSAGRGTARPDSDIDLLLEAAAQIIPVV